MRKLIPAFALAALTLTPHVASAGPLAVGDHLQFLGTEGTLGGGAFLVDNTGDSVFDFKTFCVQMTQYIDYSHVFEVHSITNYADDALGNDYLETATQWIFSSFQSGFLTAAGFTSDDIQAAIWRLEEQWTNDYGRSGELIADAQNAVSAGWQNDGVKVINLFYADGSGPAQDQLSLIAVAPLLPPSGTPEPATLALMGIGGAVLVARKRFAKRAGRTA